MHLKFWAWLKYNCQGWKDYIIRVGIQIRHSRKINKILLQKVSVLI